ncbi:Endosomal/vacuolar adapter protein YPT35 [Cladobotryum mycophilum]|uniref:Endosomal/vacuolar adapter protein YPT35 n=1 Tax=Cladobotryum mycophilum TaxID=491253 RepID=A0ABR0SKS9_9HYPO
MAPAIDHDQDNAPATLTGACASPSPNGSAVTHSKVITKEPEGSDLSASEHDDHPQRNGDDDDASHHVASSTTSPSSITSPPYWLNVNPHQRSVSNISSESVLPVGAITLRDNDTQDDDRNSACWAKSVEIIDHTVVNGSGASIGSFVVWIVRVETLNGSYMNIRKRYSEFDDFRHRLIATFPSFKAAMPELPPKSVIFKFRPNFLEKRRAGLQYFLNCILLNPEFSGSPVLKEFLFA